MINVTIGTNTSRKKVIVDPNTTLRDILSENDVNTGVGTIHINGAPITASDLGRTLNEIGVTDNAFIIAVAKADNA